MSNLFSPPDESIFTQGGNDTVELLKAWGATSFAFAVALIGGQILDPRFFQLLIIAALTCGVGFVVHELAHRVVARRFGAEAHFVANNGMLLVSILLAFTGFFIAAPGAVWHRGATGKREGGLIALAGPVSNYVLALLFLVLIVVANRTPVAPDWLGNVGALGFRINSWLGLFNMIPFGPFDGAKVLNWNVVVFGVTVGVGILLSFVVPRYL